MEPLRKLGQQLMQLWQGMSPARRISLSIVAAICAAAIGGVWYWASQPDYSVLFSSLPPEDAGAVINKLQAQGVPYRLSGGGTTILVPTEQVQQRRIEMAVEGLPAKGDKGWSGMESSPLGTTPFTEHLNFMRALQAELAKTIMQIDPVTFARVHIVRPDPSPFIRDQKPTTASVMLRLRPGTTLNRNAATAIVALVSRSVEGLGAENITLVDTNGRLLSDPSAEGGSMNSQMEFRRELETYLASKAEGMLAQLLGPGRAIVRVTADLNFQRVHEKKETYSPEGRVVTTEKITSSKGGTGSNAPRGPAGTASNLNKQASTPAATTTTNVDETIETGYAVSKVTQELEDKLGSVERLTIAALVDLSQAPDAKAAGSPGLSLADVQDHIKQAVGFKPNRDQIKVSDVKLPAAQLPPPVEEETGKLQTWHDTLAIIRNASLGLAALVALVLGWMVIRRVLPAVGSVAAAPAAPAVQPTPRVAEAMQNNPEALARLLAGWLDQSERQRKNAA